jgi:thymidine kinase
MAKLYFFYGAMNSGKTTRILQCAYNYEEQGMKPIIMKPKIDTKGEGHIVSRIGSKRKVDYLIDANVNIYDIIVEKYTNVDLIIVDEAQFLTERQVNQLMDAVIDLDISIMCYGLRTDFMGNSFPGARRLLDIAHELSEVKTICECGHKAMFNVRLIDGKVQTEGDSVAIDGEGKVTYTVACPRCFRLKTHRKFDKERKDK